MTKNNIRSKHLSVKEDKSTRRNVTNYNKNGISQQFNKVTDRRKVNENISGSDNFKATKNISRLGADCSVSNAKQENCKTVNLKRKQIMNKNAPQSNYNDIYYKKRKENNTPVSFNEIEKKIFSGIKIQSKSLIEKESNATNEMSNKKKRISDPASFRSANMCKLKKKSMSKREHVHNINNEKVNPNSSPNVATDKYFPRSKMTRPTSSIGNINKTKRASKNEKETQSESSDWEDVDELTELLKSDTSRQDPTCRDVQIELEAESTLWGMKRRRQYSKQDMIEDHLRKGINRAIKTVHENMHKTHLLCLVAHGLYLNSILGLETIMSLALSIVPKNYYSPKRQNMTHLEKFLSWFGKHIPLSVTTKLSDKENNASYEQLLCRRFEMKSANSSKELVLMFIVTARAVGMKVRFVMSLNAISWKPTQDALIKPKKKSDIYEEASSSNVCNIPETSKVRDTDMNLAHSISEKEKNVGMLKKKNQRMLSTDSEDDVRSKKPTKLKNLKTSQRPRRNKLTCSSDEDFEMSLPKTKCKSKKRSSYSHDDENRSKKSKRESCTEWAEVYLEEEEKWISVDVIRKKIHCASEIESCSRLAYVVAFNPDQTIKDVTRRYVSNWLSSKEKIRCDGLWWNETLKPFLGPNDFRDKAEDKEMDNNLERQPLPQTINEYKNHSLYALQRHLLKFEAIYPPDESPVGYIKGEPVFSRDSVQTLSGREAWIKEAKTVKVDQEPYKIVKARPKWDKSSCKLIKDRPLELFGSWQVEDYEPPIARNGKVPRNEYGNVELFKSCMLPKGCVHLTLNGLNRVARKLNIDCAPAIVGFDFHCGGSHPVCDGYVVCQEFKDILVDAWKEDQAEQARREEERRIKRIYNNWTRLINGITMKDRLKEKYGVICKEEKKTKKKVKQGDLDSLQNVTVSKQAVALKIDLTTSVTSRNAKTRKRGRRLPKEKLEETENLSSDSDDEEMTLQEKKEKIRNILQWNPKNATSEADGPELSDGDESDQDDRSQVGRNDNRLKPNLDENQVSFRNGEGVAVKKRQKIPAKTSKELREKVKNSIQGEKKVKNSLQQSKIAPNTDSGTETLSDSETNVSMGWQDLEKQKRRRSVRNKKLVKPINYKDSDDSETHLDLSGSDSDCADKTYVPEK